MGRPKKSKTSKTSELTDSEIIKLPQSKRQEYFYNNNIPDSLLKALFRQNKKSGEVSEILGQVYLAITKKVSGMPSWQGYSSDWKEEFQVRGLEHLCKYGHNFKAEKSTRDATNYLIQICFRAFIQSLKKCKKIAENEGIELNEAYNPNHQKDITIEESISFYDP